MMMMYAGSKTNLVHAAELTKVKNARKIQQRVENMPLNCFILTAQWRDATEEVVLHCNECTVNYIRSCFAKGTYIVQTRVL